MNKLINELEGIVRWPKKPSDKQDVIEWLSTKLKFQKQYSEEEVNEKIKAYFSDLSYLNETLLI